MHFSVVFSTLASLLAVQVTASQILEARQSTTGLTPASIPSSCTKACSALQTASASCTDLSCMCTNSFAQSMQSCFDCSLSLVSSADLASDTQSAQQSFDGYESACSQAGFTLTPLTIKASKGAAMSLATVSGAALSVVVGGVVMVLSN